MKHRKITLSLFACALLLCWVFFSSFLATNLIFEHRLKKADAILVLSGSQAYKERTATAARLFSDGVAPVILISDDGGRAGWSQAEKTNLPFVELARRELISSGVPQQAIVQLPGQVDSTITEARGFSTAAEESQIRSVLIVTSPYHTRRAYNTFDKVLKGRGIEIGIASSPVSAHTPDPGYWWLHSSGWQNVAGEYVKTLGYWVFYW